MNPKIKEIRAKSIIVKSALPDVDYVINPYVGCQHSCIYCYSEFIKRFTNHHEPWSSFIDIKINAPELIKTNSQYHNKHIFLSSKQILISLSRQNTNLQDKFSRNLCHNSQ